MEYWITAIFGFMGVLIGAAISGLANYIINERNLKNNLVQIKVKLYIQGIMYIKQLKKIIDNEKYIMLDNKNINSDKFKEDMLLEESLYNGFYYYFCLIASDKLVEDFNKIINEVQHNKNKKLPDFVNDTIGIFKTDLKQYNNKIIKQFDSQIGKL